VYLQYYVSEKEIILYCLLFKRMLESLKTFISSVYHNPFNEFKLLFTPVHNQIIFFSLNINKNVLNKSQIE
jgi:hypothetical protein